MNSEINKLEYKTLVKYFEGKASEDESSFIHQWLHGDRNNFLCEKYVRQLWNELDVREKESELNSEEMLNKLHHEINLRSKKESEKTIHLRSRKPGMSFSLVLKNLGRAAAILLLPVMGYIGWEIYSQKLWVETQPDIVYNELKCPIGATSQFELPDGTKGNLNNGSSLRYPNKFTGDTREIELFGEAFFDVEHNRKRPFIIKTTGLDVKVLGTRLNVYSYPEEDYQEITLESGSAKLTKMDEEKGQEVSIVEMKPGHHVVYRFGSKGSHIQPQQKSQELIVAENTEELNKLAHELKNGQQALYSSGEGDLFVMFDKTEKYTGWTEGKLILRNDPMPVLLKRIERWYSVKFNIRDKQINDYTYWATFEEENIDQVLKLLSLTGPIKFINRPREIKPDGTYESLVIDVMLE